MFSDANLNLLYELDRLQACRKAVSDLLIPESDLHLVDRSALNQLLSYFDDKEAYVIEGLRLVLTDPQ